jgi:hypothetical protein
MSHDHEPESAVGESLVPLTTDVCTPDARHLIWVARNLLWQAHEAFRAVDSLLSTRGHDRVVVRTNIRACIELVDQLDARLKAHPAVPCTTTTMPPGHDNAWRHFLEHVAQCYLQPIPESKHASSDQS